MDGSAGNERGKAYFRIGERGQEKDSKRKDITILNFMTPLEVNKDKGAESRLLIAGERTLGDVLKNTCSREDEERIMAAEPQQQTAERCINSIRGYPAGRAMRTGRKTHQNEGQLLDWARSNEHRSAQQ